MKLSKNFSLKEMTTSSTATRLRIPNEPQPEHLINLAVLVHKILQPVRDKFGVVTVNSGYRSSQLNKAVGGSQTSQHCNGEAADIECYGIPNKQLAEWIRDNCDFDQIILEFYDPADPQSGWVHVSNRLDGSNRKACLSAVREGGRLVYRKGFI